MQDYMYNQRLQPKKRRRSWSGNTPGGISETEILFPYGSMCFASKVGLLAGNHFLTITQGRELLGQLGQLVLMKGAQEILIQLILSIL